LDSKFSPFAEAGNLNVAFNVFITPKTPDIYTITVTFTLLPQIGNPFDFYEFGCLPSEILE